MFRDLLPLLGCLLGFAASASAGPIFSGNFTSDDNVVFFHYQVQNTALVDVFTTSYAGGGFSPILTLFGANGEFLFDNAGYPTDTDAALSWNSVAGMEYIIALTQYDNYAIGPTLADGFRQQGMGNYTAEPPFNPTIPGGSFLLPGPTQRSSAWSVSFESNEPTLSVSGPSAIPEPATTVLTLCGVLALAVWTRRRSHQGSANFN